MTNFWDDLSDSIARGVDAVVDKTSSIVDKGRGKLEVAKLERQRDEKIFDLGQSFYRMKKDDQLQIAELEIICNEVKWYEEQIEAARNADNVN